MTDLQRYQCDFCKNAYNKAPAATHTIDGQEKQLCEECKREFDRITDFPEDAEEWDYQYHGIYVPKSVEGESTWRHAAQVKNDKCGLAEWVFLDWLLLAIHEHPFGPDDEDSYNEYAQQAENDVRTDENFNKA